MAMKSTKIPFKLDSHPPKKNFLLASMNMTSQPG